MDPEQDMEKIFDPLLLDLDDNPVWVHGCESVKLEEDEESIVAIHLILSQYKGQCDMGEDHFIEVGHLYDSARARQLAAALLNAADALDELTK